MADDNKRRGWQRERNLCPYLGKAEQRIIDDSVKMFSRVDEDLAKDIAQGNKNIKAGKRVGRVCM